MKRNETTDTVVFSSRLESVKYEARLFPDIHGPRGIEAKPVVLPPFHIKPTGEGFFLRNK